MPDTIGPYMLAVEEPNPGRKTRVWRIENRRSGATLGAVRWEGPWRQYVFFPTHSTLFAAGCLCDLAAFISGMQTEHHAAMRRRKEAPDDR